MDPTDRFLLVQDRLGQDLNAYLAEAKAAGRSTRTIAAELNDFTHVGVSREAVRRWLLWLDRNEAA